MFMTRANIWNELRRVNVGWVALALVCLVTVMWLAACGEAEERSMVEEEPAVEEQPVVEVQPEPEETPVAEAEPTVTEVPTQATEIHTAEMAEEAPKKELEAILHELWNSYRKPEETPKKGYQAIDIKVLEECEAMTPINDILLHPSEHSPEETTNFINRVREKYADLFERHPGFLGTGSGFLTAEGGGDVELTKENGEVGRLLGITVTVEDVLDQDSLPEDQRIPDCLDGVPIQRNRVIEITPH